MLTLCRSRRRSFDVFSVPSIQQDACVQSFNSGLFHGILTWMTHADQTEKCYELGRHAILLTPHANDTRLGPETIALCLPVDCDETFVRHHLLQAMLPNKILNQRVAPIQAQRLRIDRVARLSDLPPDVRPDFVIAGFPLSGTTSVAMELAKHPHVIMPHVEDQIFWTRTHTQRSLRRWSRPYLRIASKKRVLHRSGKPRLLCGLKEPMMVYSDAAMKFVAQVPGIKVIVLIREPITMMQSWMNHGGYWFTPWGDELTYGAGLLHRNLVSHVLDRIPQRQLLLVPLDALASNASQTYRRILAFLGLPMLLESVRRTSVDSANRVVKRNALTQSLCTMPGRCVDLCTAPHDLHDALIALYKLDVKLIDGLLADHGWSASIRGLLPQPTCASGGPTLRNAGGGLCESGVNTCFTSKRDCLEHCDAVTSKWTLYGEMWMKCCRPMQDGLIQYIRHHARITYCGGARARTFGCSRGRGRAMFFTIP